MLCIYQRGWLWAWWHSVASDTLGLSSASMVSYRYLDNFLIFLCFISFWNNTNATLFFPEFFLAYVTRWESLSKVPGKRDLYINSYNHRGIIAKDLKLNSLQALKGPGATGSPFWDVCPELETQQPRNMLLILLNAIASLRVYEGGPLSEISWHLFHILMNSFTGVRNSDI